MLKTIIRELKEHVGFTIGGSLVGVAVFALFIYTPVLKDASTFLFQTFHPLHVLISAVATVSMYRLHGKPNFLAALVVGYVGSVGIATLSDSLIPYVGELLLGLQTEHVHAQVHAGFLQEWWLVNPLALIGIGIGYFRPHTKLPHSGHVALSMAASLFHMLMAFEHGSLDILTAVLIPVFLFLAVWVPCCSSDIVFPLLFTFKKNRKKEDE